MGLKGLTLVIGQRSSRGFYGSSYEGGPGVADKTLFRFDLWCFCPRTPAEELSVLPILPLLGLIPLGGGKSPSPLVLLPLYTSSYFSFNVHV